MKRISKINISILIVAISFIMAFCVACSCNSEAANAQKDIGVAWCDESSYKNIVLSVEEAGGQATVVDKVKSSEVKYEGDDVSSECLDEYGMLKNEYAEKIKEKNYDKTNVADIVKGHKAIIFPGGADICPSLYADPEPWYDYSDKPEFNPTRDVSDYILMSYCLDNDIPVMGICRGMQMYAVVTGATLTQDIPTYYKSLGVAYNGEHIKSGELNGKAIRGNHPVNIFDKHSLLYNIYQTDTILKPYSSHHQAVLAVDNTKAKVVATATVNGVTVIEGLERADSGAFGLFVQFHPEHSLARWVNNSEDKTNFMSYEDSLKPFKYLVKNIK